MSKGGEILVLQAGQSHFNPLEDVFINLGFVHFIEHFVSATGVELHEDISDASFAECFVGSFDACTVFTNGVILTCKEENRGLLVHLVNVRLLCDKSDAAHHISVQAGLAHKAAAGVGNVFIHFFRTAAYPVKFGSGIFDAIVI